MLHVHSYATALWIPSGIQNHYSLSIFHLNSHVTWSTAVQDWTSGKLATVLAVSVSINWDTPMHFTLKSCCNVCTAEHKSTGRIQDSFRSIFPKSKPKGFPRTWKPRKKPPFPIQLLWRSKMSLWICLLKNGYKLSYSISWFLYLVIVWFCSVKTLKLCKVFTYFSSLLLQSILETLSNQTVPACVYMLSHIYIVQLCMCTANKDILIILCSSAALRGKKKC